MVMLPAMMEERQPMQEDMQILLLEGIAGVFLIYLSISSVDSSNSQTCSVYHNYCPFQCSLIPDSLLKGVCFVFVVLANENNNN